MGYSPRKRLEESLTAGFAQVTQLYGIPSNLGRLYGLLYLSPEPLSLTDLAEAVGAAKSTTSVALRRLERARFVRKLPRGSDRQDYYAAVTDPLEIMQDWLRHFVATEMQVGEEMVERFDADLTEAAWAGEYSKEQTEILRKRLAEMQRGLVAGKAMIEMLGSDGALDEMVARLTGEAANSAPGAT